MNQRQKEIYDDIIYRRGPKNPLTKSQKRHLKRVAKKRERSENRKKKQLLEQENSGKLIEENHNNGEYSSDYTDKAANWYLSRLSEYIPVCLDSQNFILYFQHNRIGYQTLLLKWSPELPRDDRFYFFKNLLDLYWEDKTNGETLWSCAKNYLENRT